MLTTHHFLFTATVVSPLLLDDHSGAALRGNLFNAIWKRFCNNKSAPSCAVCPLHTICPVSALVAPLREENPGGRDIPRPYIILPPLVTTHMYAPGETFTFGITLFGSIIQLLPYLVMSIQAVEENGLGRKLSENQGQRGKFSIQQIETYHPLTGERNVIYRQGQAIVQVPTLSVSPEDIRASVKRLPTDRITLEFLTPTRIIDQERLVHRLTFRPFVLRLTQRLRQLQAEYGQDQGYGVERMVSKEHTQEDTREDGPEEHQREQSQPDLIRLASSIVVEKDETTWEDVKSYSSRQRRTTPVGGLMGMITFAGNLEPFRELLIWGELIHVGRSVVKGNGWYRIVEQA